MRKFLWEKPWSAYTRDEVLSDAPGLEIEVDGDRKTIRGDKVD